MNQIRNRKINESKEDYRNIVEDNLSKFLKDKLNLENIKKSNIYKLLEIEKSKIFIYSINISNLNKIPENYHLNKFIDLYHNNNIFTKLTYDKKLFKKKKLKNKYMKIY